jgi:transposase
LRKEVPLGCTGCTYNCCMGRKEPQPHDWREWRRFRAWGLYQDGWRQCAIAEVMNVSDRAVRGWLARARTEGPESLRSHPPPGSSPQLTPEQKRWIPDFLWHGAEAYGFRGDFWNCGRVACVLNEEFGVTYHPGHVSRILKDLGWTPQLPITRAIQRDEEGIRCWQRDVWPELVKRAKRERRTLIFVDESGFYLLPSIARTYAPAGRTPVLHDWQTRDHLSVMGGVTSAGRFYTVARQESLNGMHTITFLTHILHYADRWLVIWDGSPIHRRAEVRDYVDQLPRRRIQLERLPPYAPDLNPVEWVWRHLKHVEMRNVVCLDLEDIHQEFHMAVGRLRHKSHLFDSFFRAAGLDYTNRCIKKTGTCLRNAQ